MPHIKDPAVRADAELFCQQEAQHSRQHLAHMKVLSAHYPGLDEVRREVTASYERLFERESMDFHLSYAASVELCFGPIGQLSGHAPRCTVQGRRPDNCILHVVAPRRGIRTPQLSD
jgi:predicted metal-dependent hydrolase